MKVRIVLLIVLASAVFTSHVRSDQTPSEPNYRLTAVTRQFGAWGLVEMDTNGDNPVLLVNRPIWTHRWSPDGSQVVYVGWPDDHKPIDGREQIFVMNADGTDNRQLTDNMYQSIHPAWSPDGKKIAFVSQAGPEEKSLSLIVMDADGDNPVNLGAFAVDFERHGLPMWTPDGGKITFFAIREGKRRLLIMNADGSGTRDLLNQSLAFRGGGDWSPDGRLLVFATYADDRTVQLFVTDDGVANVRQITTAGERNQFPTWSPDGRYIAYVAFETWSDSVPLGDLMVFDVATETHTRAVAGMLHRFAGGRPAWRSITNTVQPE